MSHYTVIFAPKAKKQIDKLPKSVKTRIAGALKDVLSRDPFIGKALKAELKGLCSYRVGDYRIVYSIERHKLIIQIIRVMHRKEAYR